ncbi:MAG: helix-turn-helix domain-containing protein [Pirellulaceae bacterium]
MTDVQETPASPETKFDPFSSATMLRAFVECSREMQEVALEMSDILLDKESTQDEREMAFDAMIQALFPGMSMDILEGYRQHMKGHEAAEAASALHEEERTFADRVRTEMRKKDVTQEQLAKAANISQPAVSNILNRHCRPQRKTVVKFAESLGVSPKDLWPDFDQEG